MPTPAVEVALIEAVANRTPLNPGQVALVREMATSGARLQLAIAPAGSGKTTAMRALATAWRNGGGTVVGLVMAVSMCAYGVVSLAIFTFGEDVAKERGRGWTRTLSATPLPTWVYLVGKLANALVLGTVIVAAIASLAFLLGGADLALGTWVQVWLLMLAGVLAFSTLGFAIAFVARPRAAAMIANLVFLPLAFASGFFVPMNQLPQVLRDIAAFLPTFHFGQLAHHLVMPASDVAFWTGAETRPLWVHVVWVAGSAVALGTVALMASRREAVTRRG